MKTTMRVEIINVKNASDLSEFVPVEGEFTTEVRDEDDDCGTQVVEQAIRNWIDTDYPISVRVFHADGRAITGDVPSRGTFIATRELR